ncbi:hypothetical protein niasHT_017580 [Heterodera trifolii]|uniref:Uncharacterized protein n=1 Tax=Heterodera trifolii TaxID=157864 RepID=A0ABD2LAY3_9BILA
MDAPSGGQNDEATESHREFLLITMIQEAALITIKKVATESFTLHQTPSVFTIDQLLAYYDMKAGSFEQLDSKKFFSKGGMGNERVHHGDVKGGKDKEPVPANGHKNYGCSVSWTKRRSHRKPDGMLPGLKKQSVFLVLQTDKMRAKTEELRKFLLEKRKTTPGDVVLTEADLHDFLVEIDVSKFTAGGTISQEKNETLDLEDFGRDLRSVKALLRKHEGMERDLTALGDKIRALDEKSFGLNKKVAQVFARVIVNLTWRFVIDVSIRTQTREQWRPTPRLAQGTLW